MEFETTEILGPKTATVNKSTALEQLQDHPRFPKGAKIVDFDEKNGHWVAKLKVRKKAGPFPPGADDSSSEPTPPEEAGPPKDESFPSEEDSP